MDLNVEKKIGEKTFAYFLVIFTFGLYKCIYVYLYIIKNQENQRSPKISRRSGNKLLVIVT